MKTPLALLVSAALACAAQGWTQNAASDASGPAEPCVVGGSPNVLIEGRPMLRLSDVSACDPRTYEIIPSVFVNGEPAVRLLPDPEAGEAPRGADSVLIEDQSANTAGDAR